MLAYTAESLICLTKAYLAVTGFSVARLGLIVAGNDKLFQNLLKGADCTTATALRATEFFDLNWPPTVEWPAEVWRRPVWMLYRDSVRGPNPHVKAALQRRAATDAARNASKHGSSPRRRRVSGNSATA